VAPFLGRPRGRPAGPKSPILRRFHGQVLAAYTGCLLTRRFSAAAFESYHRAMTAPDLIEAIGPVFEEFSPARS